MKWGLRFFGIADILTFLILIQPKFNFLLTTFSLPFSAAQKVGAIWEVIVLSLFLFTGILLLKSAKSGLLLSFVLIIFRISFLYFSFDFLSYLAFYLGFKNVVSTNSFQNGWFYVLMVLEMIRYSISAYWYAKLIKR